MRIACLSGNAARRSLFSFLVLALGLLLSSCGFGPRLQPEITGLIVSNQVSLAADKLEAEKADYGSGNYLLYYLDRGLVEFYAGRHKESISSFEKAKQRFVELYTESLSKEALSWVVNDYMLPYRGADHEYVLVNIFQSLNFIALGNRNEALVEGRDLASKYQVVTDTALKQKRRHFEDNGFARLFMGLLYGSVGRAQDRDEARLWYEEAAGLYRSYYEGGYVPHLLEENLQAVNGRVSGAQDMSARAQIIVIQLAGFSPVKVAEVVAVPIDMEIVAKMAFPRFMKRDYQIRSARIIAESEGRFRVVAETELGLDIEDLAIKDLESRKALTLAKAVLRPAAKYLIERNQKKVIEKKNGQLAGDLFGLASSLYNLYSEQADLRSWQALPAQIRVARLFVEPGTLSMRMENLGGDGAVISTEVLPALELSPGETRFVIVRSVR